MKERETCLRSKYKFQQAIPDDLEGSGSGFPFYRNYCVEEWWVTEKTIQSSDLVKKVNPVRK